MNANERQLLSRFLDQMKKAGQVEKDPEADALINAAVREQSDAPYLLVQRTLLLEQALENAKAKIASLEQNTRSSSSFLGGQQTDPWASSPSVAPPRQQAAAYSPALAQPYMPAPTAGSSFLGNVATTAAGVVAGSFLFQGIENLMHSGHGSSGWGSDSAMQDHLTENTTINNYYGSDVPQDHSDFMTAAYDDNPSTASDFDGIESDAGDDNWL